MHPFETSEHSCGIAVMAKASAPGRTKTRLAPPLTLQEAADFNTAFLQDVSANILAADRLLGRPQLRVYSYMAFGPPGSEDFFKDILPAEVGLFEAWLDNFGACLLKATETLLAMGHSSAVVLNADSPTLPTALLVETAEALARPGDRAVIGPSSDGGYYLLGVRQAHRRLFEDIDWSTDRVFPQTLERAHEIGLDVHQLPVWYDVDDVAALRVLQRELFMGGSFDTQMTPNTANYTAQLMKRLLATAGLRERIEEDSASTKGRSVR